jgi:hypothetical protein
MFIGENIRLNGILSEDASLAEANVHADARCQVINRVTSTACRSGS